MSLLNGQEITFVVTDPALDAEVFIEIDNFLALPHDGPGGARGDASTAAGTGFGDDFIFTQADTLNGVAYFFGDMFFKLVAIETNGRKCRCRRRLAQTAERHGHDIFAILFKQIEIFELALPLGYAGKSMANIS